MTLAPTVLWICQDILSYWQYYLISFDASGVNWIHHDVELSGLFNSNYMIYVISNHLVNKCWLNKRILTFQVERHETFDEVLTLFPHEYMSSCLLVKSSMAMNHVELINYCGKFTQIKRTFIDFLEIFKFWLHFKKKTVSNTHRFLQYAINLEKESSQTVNKVTTAQWKPPRPKQNQSFLRFCIGNVH